jgi:glutathione S-transferase
MKLYYSPGACSLASHIALLEGGFEFELERVDLKRKITETGRDFTVINAKGYVPALVLDSGYMITENPAVLDWITTQYPELGINETLGRTRMFETLSYLSSEIHKGFHPLFHGAVAAERISAEIALIKRLHWLADRMEGRYLFGDQPTVADFYLFVMLRWAAKMGIAVPAAFVAFKDRMLARPNVRAAIEYEEMPALNTGTR